MNTDLEILHTYLRRFGDYGYTSASEFEILSCIVAETQDVTGSEMPGGIDKAREDLVKQAQTLDVPFGEYLSAIDHIVAYTCCTASSAAWEIRRVLDTFRELRTGQPTRVPA